MCLLIVQPPKTSVPESHFRAAWDANQHGAGYAFAHGGKLIIRRPFKKLRDMIKTYAADLEAHPSAAFLIHFRYATHGGISDENTHPFDLGNGVAFAHNGILSAHESPCANESDTRFFARSVLAQRDARQFADTGFLAWLEELVGPHNKLGFLSRSGVWSIVGESRGVWLSGVWYSNTSFQPSARPTWRSWQGWRWGDIDTLADCQVECADRYTSDELHALGFDAGYSGTRYFDDADMLGESEWSMYRAGLAEGMAKAHAELMRHEHGE